MKVTLFVTGSAAILAAWLGTTYFETVPVKNYPQLGRGSVPLSAQAVSGSSAPVAAKKAPAANSALARSGSGQEMEVSSH